jgi:hypothetical protein
MLELAPEYFKFTQSTYNKATSLVKIVGFFSGESRSCDFDIADTQSSRTTERAGQRRTWTC